MPSPEKIESLIKNLPDAESARRFYAQFVEKFPVEERKLARSEGLLSDVLTLAAFSPLLATTILQNPDYVSWLNRQRLSTKVRGKDEILESLAQFALTNSDIETNVLLARFRRRELLRIYLRDIRNLATVAEITEEISNLADAILEYTLTQARRELDNRFGSPLEINENAKARQACFSIIALGKLGSMELNYSSDIDLLFLYSADGATSGRGTHGAVTNREYFIKLSELIIRLVGAQTGEGAAYRVDMRLRPHGRVGALAISFKEAVSYYQKSAQSWERQVLIRSRASAGDAEIFQKFFERVKTNVFSTEETVETALSNVRLSKDKINTQKTGGENFNVKLGKGGIREIEFIAQALQLAYAGRDEWLRASHTLISLSRLADRRLISKTELTELFEAYKFLRRLEHRLQMENGLQTHLVPADAEKRILIARRMDFETVEKFDAALTLHTKNVSRIFGRVFDTKDSKPPQREIINQSLENPHQTERFVQDESRAISPVVENSNIEFDSSGEDLSLVELKAKVAAHFVEMIAANSHFVKNLMTEKDKFDEKNYSEIFLSNIEKGKNFKDELAVLRKTWTRFVIEILVFDVSEKITRQQAKRMQTALAEASIEAAIFIARRELERRFSIQIAEFDFAVLGLGKLGGGGMDYGSDLDLILVYDDEKPLPVEDLTPAEFYSRAVEIFVTALSSLTRDGFLYRVDLRLRPDGKNGATSISKTAFLNYLKTRAAIWEWLAYIKLRGVAGDLELARETEFEARRIIHESARKSRIEDLREETGRIRERLEEEKAGGRGKRGTDIKFGAGGMLDIYFAVRFLQLRDDVRDAGEIRTTDFMLEKLYANNSLGEEDFRNFSEGYAFLSELDHHLRLAAGRSTRLPAANQVVLETISERMKLGSVKELLEQLTLRRLSVRLSFENVLEIDDEKAPPE